MVNQSADNRWMRLALAQAKAAANKNEVPVGAILVVNDKKISEGHNLCVSTSDPSAHAEVVTMRRAGKHLENYRLVDSTLYVTLEPCAMCVGAIIHARVKHVVFGASDPKTGAAGGCFNLLQDSRHNQVPEVTGGVLAEESSELLKSFFRARR